MMNREMNPMADLKNLRVALNGCGVIGNAGRAAVHGDVSDDDDAWHEALTDAMTRLASARHSSESVLKTKNSNDS